MNQSWVGLTNRPLKMDGGEGEGKDQGQMETKVLTVRNTHIIIDIYNSTPI
jgi:hypothetical protein